MNYRILVVEDDQYIRGYLEEILKDANYTVKSTDDGAQALKLVADNPPSLLLLDLGIKNVTGESVCAEVKKKHPEVPVIILTAKNTTSDVVRGLDIGADDYISKPFETEELLARIRVQLKQKTSPVIQIEDLKLDTTTLKVERDGKPIDLTATEFKLLEYLMVHQGMVMSRESILDHIWMYSPDVESRVVDVYIGYLRKKVDTGFKKKLINSVRGFGYSIRP